LIRNKTVRADSLMISINLGGAYGGDGGRIFLNPLES